MGLAILKLKKINFTTIRILFFLGIYIYRKVLVSNKYFLGKKTINTLFVICIMILKLSHHM